MDHSCPSSLDNHNSRTNVRIENILSESSTNIRDVHTPETYHQPTYIPEVLRDGFGNPWPNEGSWLDFDSIGLQFPEILPMTDDSDSVIGILNPNSAGTQWLPSSNADSRISETISTDIHMPDYQYPQYGITHEGMRLPVLNSVSNGGRSPVSLMVDGSSPMPTVNPSQASGHSDGGHVTLGAVESSKKRMCPERRPRSLRWMWQDSFNSKRMKLSDKHQCPRCDQTFKRRDNIRPHVWRKHFNDYESLFPRSRSTSTPSCPTQTTRLTAVRGHDLGSDESAPLTNRSTLHQDSELPGPIHFDVAGSGGSTIPQKRSIDILCLEDSATADTWKRQSVPRLSTDESMRPLACPFQKREPYRYQRCFALSLQRIKDVKQHIYRCHAKPEYYCASCYEVFDSAKDRDEHSRRRECTKLDSPCLPQFEGITEDQRKQLTEKSSRTLDVVGQWFQIWSVVFPDALDSRPRSVYLGNVLEELVPLLRREWKSQNSDIIAQAAEMSSQQLSHAIKCAMEMFFDFLEGGTAQNGDTDECASVVEI